ncbi:MAG: FAD-dependent oxidoreductase [Acidiferrobacteraceae bacterium]|jgi:4-methylaminobutanoate oxidase (formaldehyde-forming)|nr:FAD-dependent oxidoreductase [Acidiferrobacteraceae bacterium]MCP4829498.1 FAD-dependent oxidoreductase [Pseudomonadota bacterium]HJP07934.1 FAD-dependent oxidoreductase [Arenicellales bacterium]|tara:strand:- start:11697 stop:14141 length:2445 start_codon:yes stop_codon:yes gene_type:complete
MKELPRHTQAIVVGGGIAGCSTAYHLAQLGYKNIVLLERNQLTSGSTWHAAGLVGQLRSQAGITQLLGHSISLYDRLEAETGLATGWKMNGGLRLACNEARLTEIQRQATTARSFGLEMQLLTPSEARDLWPLMDISDVIGAAFLPSDGQASPSDITQALAKGARDRGVGIFERVRVTGVRTEHGRVKGVDTSAGSIDCEVLVNCAGQWARELGLLAGVNVPLVSVQHQYLITEAIDGVTSDLPTLRDPDRLTYYKEEVGGLVMGGYEANPVGWAQQGFPEEFAFTLLDSNWDHFEQLMALALPRVPALQHAGVKELLNGPESFTPDGNFILGEAPELAGFYVAAGFNAFGIAAGGGAGQALAQWIIGGEPPYDLWPVDIRRFGKPHQNLDWVRSRTHEMYGKHYTIAWPFEEHESGRPFRRSPLYDELRERGACFGEKLGWERPNWFAPKGVKARDEYSFNAQNWLSYSGAEHKAAREGVAIFDQTSFGKFMVKGADSVQALEWVCANRIDRPVGSVIYTQLLNTRGGIECDLTVARVSEEVFYLVTGTGSVTHDFHWIQRNLCKTLDVQISDQTDHFAVLSIMGPRSRDLLARVTTEPVDNDALPFAMTRPLLIGETTVTAVRLTYVGELGFELHIPVSDALGVYQSLMSAGADMGIHNAGYRAIESLRLEKGYRAWGSDLSADHTPLEAGLGWAVKLESDIDFLGKAALMQQQSEGLKKQLACFTVEDIGINLIGRETLYRDDQRVGWLTSAGYGHTVGCPIGFGYVRNPDGVDQDYLKSGTYSLDIAGVKVPCMIHLKPLYDPSMSRVRL